MIEDLPAKRSQKKTSKDYSRCFTIERHKTALLIVDMQYASASRLAGLGREMTFKDSKNLDWRFERIENLVIPNIQRLLTFFRRNKMPVIYVVIRSQRKDYSDMPLHMRSRARGGPETREAEILDELRPEPTDLVLSKTTISAFTSTNLDTSLKALGVEYLVFTGVSTNVCVDTTARDAADRGYRCVVLDDACAAIYEKKYHNFALSLFGERFGRVENTANILAELANE